MKRVAVSVRETMVIVGIVLLVDVAILTVWTIVDPLHWERSPLVEDKYGYALESEGHCTSEHWHVFAGIMGVFHFLLIARACYMCYLARGLPEKFSSGKYVSIAMFSNLQILLVAVPLLVILGSEPQSSFFLRSVVIWLNDFVIVVVIFGRLIYNIYTWDKFQMRSSRALNRVSSHQVLQQDLREYAKTMQSQRTLQTKRGSVSTIGTSSNHDDSFSRSFDWSSDHGTLRRASLPLYAVTEEEKGSEEEESSLESQVSMEYDVADKGKGKTQMEDGDDPRKSTNSTEFSLDPASQQEEELDELSDNEEESPDKGGAGTGNDKEVSNQEESLHFAFDEEDESVGKA